MMGTEIFKIDASWADKLTKTRVSFLSAPTVLRHYAKRALTSQSLNVKLGPRRKGHKGRAVCLA